MKKQSKNYKILIIGVVIGIVISSTVAYAQATLGASSVAYNNDSSKLSSTTVQGAIDEIYNNAKGGNITYHNANIVGAYLYDPDKCTTGDEVTCRKTACPNNTSESTCPSGTIIKYKVNESTTKIFHVLHDDTSILTLQQNKNTAENVAWYSSEDNTKGPLTALEALESETAGWSNVNTMKYTMGTTAFGKDNNAYTGCTCNESGCSCTTNAYTLETRNAKARMITVQEANMVGCTNSNNSCPKWMNTGKWYLTMDAYISDTHGVMLVNTATGLAGTYRVFGTEHGVRAVVVISK